MAAIIATINGKVLIQLPGSEPVEVGEVEIPIYGGTTPTPKTRGREIATAHVELKASSTHACSPCEQCPGPAHCKDNHPGA